MVKEVGDKADFDSRYRFLKAIGNGGQGGVYRYEDIHSGKVVVVKEFGTINGREWRMLRAIRHPHICSLVDYTRYENHRVKVTKIVMESMDTSVQAYLDKGRTSNNAKRPPLPLSLAREIFYTTALALDYLHRKLIVHMDVKLDNILLRVGGEERREVLRSEDGRLAVKLADFGLAFHLGGEGEAAVTKFSAVGTNGYMAPEVESDTRFGVKADVYSLGVVLHVMLTGSLPPPVTASATDGQRSPRLVAVGIREDTIEDTQGVRMLLRRMLSWEPCERPYLHDILDHPFLASLRRPGDLDLGDLNAAEKDGKLLLLQVRRAAGPPLGIYVDYLDLAEIHDPQAAVVVCACPSSVENTRKCDPTTVGALMCRAGVGPQAKFKEAFALTDTSAHNIKRVVPLSGGALDHVRSLWLAMVDERGSLQRETIWRVHKGLREVCHSLVARPSALATQQPMGKPLCEGGPTDLYVCMTSGDDVVKGFRDRRTQRQYVVHELVSLAQYLAHEVSHEELQAVVIYTWREESLALILDLLTGLREDFHGMIGAARAEDQCVDGHDDLLPYLTRLRHTLHQCKPLQQDHALHRILQPLEGLRCYRAVVSLCAAAGGHLRDTHVGPLLPPHSVAEAGEDEEEREDDETARLRQDEVRRQKEVESCLDMLTYNGDKAAWDAKMPSSPPPLPQAQSLPSPSTTGASDTNTLCVLPNVEEQQAKRQRNGAPRVELCGSYEAILSIKALITLVRAITLADTTE